MNVTMDCLDIRIRNRVPWSMVPRFRGAGVDVDFATRVVTDVDFAMRVVTEGIFSSVHPWYIGGRFVLE